MKIQYQLLAIEVDKLYTKEFSPSDINGINQHLNFIQQYIESCGWSVDDFIHQMMFGPDINLN